VVDMDHPLVKRLLRLRMIARRSLIISWIVGIGTILTTIIVQIPDIIITMMFGLIGVIFMTVMMEYRFKFLAAKYEPVYTFILAKTSKDVNIVIQCERRLRELSQSKWICPPCGKKFDDGVEFSLHNHDVHDDDVDKQWRGQKNKRVQSWPKSRKDDLS